MTRRALSLLHVSTERHCRGRERQVLALATGLAERGHAVTVASIRESDLWFRVGAKGLPDGLATVRGLRGLLRRGGWDVIHLHDVAAWRALGWAALGRGPGGPPRVLSVRADVGYGRRSRLTRRLTEGPIHLWADSEWTWSALVSAGVAEERISVIHSGIDLDRFTMTSETRADCRKATRQGLGVASDALLVGTALHLVPGRGVEHLIEAVRMVREGEVPPGEPSIRLVVIGSGPQREALRRESMRRGLGGAVSFVGEQDEVPELMVALDVYVHPSAEPGGFPVALREAMALGLPVVATDVMGIREILDNGRHGLIAPVGDPEGLARNILRMWRDPAFASACGRLGSLKVQRYGLRSMLDRAEELYLRLIR